MYHKWFGPECDIRKNFDTNKYIRIYSYKKIYTNECLNKSIMYIRIAHCSCDGSDNDE